MRRLAATILVSAVLSGGLAAGSGVASAAPAGSLLPAGSVATGSMEVARLFMATGSMDFMENPIQSLGILIAAPIILLGTASHEPWDGAGIR